MCGPKAIRPAQTGTEPLIACTMVGSFRSGPEVADELIDEFVTRHNAPH